MGHLDARASSDPCVNPTLTQPDTVKVVLTRRPWPPSRTSTGSRPRSHRERRSIGCPPPPSSPMGSAPAVTNSWTTSWMRREPTAPAGARSAPACGLPSRPPSQRFARADRPFPGQPPFGLTGAGAGVLSSAADEARALGHQYVRPEHLILGLLAQPDELAARVLAELGVTPELARQHIEQRLGRHAPRPSGSLGVAPQTKRLLERARAIAKSLGHRCPRTEHILLAAVSPKLEQPSCDTARRMRRRPRASLRRHHRDAPTRGSRGRRSASAPSLSSRLRIR